MNATQYYIIDSFIKRQTLDHEPIPSDDEGDVGSDGADERADGRKKTLVKPNKKEHDEYDPDFDGESSTIRVGSSSSGQTTKKIDEPETN